MLEIKNVKDYQNIDQAIHYIHSIWGNEANFPYYYDAIIHASLEGKKLPHFYILLKNKTIIGCCGLIANDFISRHDLYPWLSSLYINEEERTHGYGHLLMNYAQKEALRYGFTSLYLVTDHDGYYEKYGWNRIEDGIDLFSCKKTRIYTKQLT